MTCKSVALGKQYNQNFLKVLIPFFSVDSVTYLFVILDRVPFFPTQKEISVLLHEERETKIYYEHFSVQVIEN